MTSRRGNQAPPSATQMKQSTKSKNPVPNGRSRPRFTNTGGARLSVIGPGGRRRFYQPAEMLDGLAEAEPAEPDGPAPTRPVMGYVRAHRASFTRKGQLKTPPVFAVEAFVNNYRAADAPAAVKKDCLAALLRLFQPMAFQRAGKWKNLRRGRHKQRECDDSLSHAIAFIIRAIATSCDIDADSSEYKTVYRIRRARRPSEITPWLHGRLRLKKEWDKFLRKEELDCHEQYRLNPVTRKREHRQIAYKQVEPEYRREVDPLTRKTSYVEVNPFDGVNSHFSDGATSEYGATDLERAIEDWIYHADGVPSRRAIARAFDISRREVDAIFEHFRDRAPDKYKRTA